MRWIPIALLGLLPWQVSMAQVIIDPSNAALGPHPSSTGPFYLGVSVTNQNPSFLWPQSLAYQFGCSGSGVIIDAVQPSGFALSYEESQGVLITYRTMSASGSIHCDVVATNPPNGDAASGDYDVAVDATPPTIALLQPTGDAGVQFPTVQIGWCDNNALNSDSRSIWVNGVLRTSSFNYVAGGTGCASPATSMSSTVPLIAGTNVIDAHICDMAGGCTTKTLLIWRAYLPVRAELTARQHFASTSGTQRFFIKNLRTVTTTLTLNYACTGTASGCSVTPTSLPTMAPGESRAATLTYNVGGAGTTGTAMLKAYDALVRDSGLVALTVVGSGAPIVSVLEANSGVAIERDLCLTVGAGSNAAFECGDLRIVHALPEIRTLNKARVPSLLYNSALAEPYPIVAASVTLPSGPLPDSVQAVLKVNGLEKARGRWAGNDWALGPTRRIGLGYSAAGDTTRVYDYTLEVARIPDSMTFTVVTGKLLVVNRRTSAFGAGWWLAGLERLEFLPDGNTLWVGGDGSARLFTAAGTNIWVAAALDRPDTLTRIGSRYYRRLPGGVTVQFNSAGQHDTTVNRLSHKTAFTYTSGRLTSIRLPLQGGAQTYTFAYNGNLLASITDPGQRVVTFGISSQRVDSIKGPDTIAVKFGYESPSSMRIGSRIDRRGTVTSYSYDAAKKIWRVHINLQPDSIRLGFQAIDALGLATATPKTAIDTANAYTSVFGERQFDTLPHFIPQETRFWLNRFGAPRRIVNALGYETIIRHEEAQWAGVATDVQGPNGFLTKGRYDARGNIIASVAENPLGTGQDAVTRYHWDPKWDVVDSMITPTGLVSSAAYDPYNGNRLWQQLGTDPARRIIFRYGNSLGLLSSTVLPQTLPDSLSYDAMGNLSVVRTPRGYDTRYTSDAQGRITVVKVRVDTLSDTLSAIYQSTLTNFDVLGRDTLLRSIGPVLGPTAAETMYVRKFLNPNGQPDSLWTWAGPDVANVDTIRTRWLYDRASHKTHEIASDQRREKWTFDDAGNVVADSTRRRHVISMTYDALNRLIRRSLPPVSDYSSRPSGIAFPPQPDYPAYQIAAQVDTFSYDSAGRILTADNADARIKRSYYRGGLLETDSTWIQTVARDDWNRHKYGLRHTYDLDGRETSLAIPEQLGAAGLQPAMAFTYDPQIGELQSVADLGGSPYTFSYNLRMELASIAYPGEYTETFSYDADGRLTTDTIRNTDDPTFPRLPAMVRATAYLYDARNNLLRGVDGLGFQDTLNVTYSGLGNLATSKLTQHGYLLYGGSNVRQVTAERFTLDALGNRKVHESFDTIPQVGGGSQYSTSYQPVLYHAGTARDTLAGTTHTRYDSAGNVEFTFGPADERASFYAADGTLRATDWRWSHNHPSPPSFAKWAFEEYRYDALGRRVLVWSKKSCVNEGWATYWWEAIECMTSLLRRTVWNGTRELAEIQMPGGDSPEEIVVRENDLATVQLASLYTAKANFPLDRNQYFGRVLYTPGRTIDQPLAITRINYEYQHDHDDGMPIPWKVAGPITTMPFWNRNGDARLGVFTNGARLLCYPPFTPPPSGDCVGVVWPYLWSAYDQRRGIHGENWFGTILERRRDKSNLTYNRNRYYDPLTGRFTQEDPIGLAGGLNLYGFAEGDPINFADPFGLQGDCKGATYTDFSKGEGEKKCDEDAKEVTADKKAASIGLLITGVWGVGRALFSRLLGRAAASGATGAAGKLLIQEGDGLLVAVQNGKIVAQSSPYWGHAELAQRAFGSATTLPPGAWVGTVTKTAGDIVAVNSKTFFGNQLPAAEAIQMLMRSVFR